MNEFQVEPGALSTETQLAEFAAGRFYIFHYTYQFEYMLDGTPCQPWNIGEWSLDKRHFNQVSPAYPLPQPPPGANAAGVWLLNAWNEAMGSIPSWPSKQPAGGEGGQVVQTLYGRRRLDWFSRHANGFEQEALMRYELILIRMKSSFLPTASSRRRARTRSSSGCAASATRASPARAAPTRSVCPRSCSRRAT